MKKWLSRLTKIAFFLFALLAIVITVLFNMGGSNDTLKGAIEDYIAQSTGFAAEIQTFNKMTFFPNISLDVEGVLLKKPDIEAMQAWAKAESEKPEEERGKIPPPISFRNPDATVDSFKIVIGFWDVGLGKTRKIRDIQIRNAQFKAGSIAHKAVAIETFGIDETPEGEPFLNIEGNWGGETFTATAGLEAKGTRTNRKYMIGEESDFEANIGTIFMEGIMRPRTMGGVHIRNMTIQHNGAEAMQTTFSLLRHSDGIVDMKGDFEMSENGSNGTFDWQFHAGEDTKTIGSIEAEIINPDDFKTGSRVSKVWAEWDRIFKDPSKTKNEGYDITVIAKDYQGAPFEGRADIKNNQVIFSAQ